MDGRGLAHRHRWKHLELNDALIHPARDSTLLALQALAGRASDVTTHHQTGGTGTRIVLQCLYCTVRLSTREDYPLPVHAVPRYQEARHRLSDVCSLT